MALPFDLGYSRLLPHPACHQHHSPGPTPACPTSRNASETVATCRHMLPQGGFNSTYHDLGPLTHVPNCPSPTPFHPVHAPASPCWSCRGKLWPGTARAAEKWPGWLWAMGNQRSGRAFLAMSVESGGLICAFY
jgi:hypothetical protein